MDVSFHHNLIVTTSHNEYIYLYDYEFAKPIKCIQLEKHCVPNAICFINGYGLLIISTNIGIIYIIDIDIKKGEELKFDVYGTINF